MWGALPLGTLALVVMLVIAAVPTQGTAARPARGGSSTPAADLPVAATDYPVPADAIIVSSTGKDAAPGTADQPLRSVAAAIALAAPGGTVVIRGGTYRETVGLVKKRITLQPYPGEHVC